MNLRNYLIAFCCAILFDIIFITIAGKETGAFFRGAGMMWIYFVVCDILDGWSK